MGITGMLFAESRESRSGVGLGETSDEIFEEVFEVDVTVTRVFPIPLRRIRVPSLEPGDELCFPHTPLRDLCQSVVEDNGLPLSVLWLRGNV
jgi:hypothetical protein